MASSSFLQGLHQVAEKLIMIGLPSLLNVAALTLEPSRFFKVADGILSPSAEIKAEHITKTAADNRIIFFIDFAFTNIDTIYLKKNAILQSFFSKTVILTYFKSIASGLF